MMKTNPAVALLALLTACPQPPEQQATTNASSSARPAGANATQSAAADGRTPIAEPKGTIDPKSAEAAGQVVQHFGALVEQKRFAEAERLWEDPSRARALSTELRDDREVHLEIGAPGDPGGAAGSIYVTVPIRLYGVGAGGAAFSRSAAVTLRRVNDVPGSTEDQRRWRIQSIDEASRR